MQLNLYKVRTSLFREGEGGSPRCSFHRGRCKLSRSCEHSPRQARSISADGMSSARPGRRSPRGVYAADQRESSGACFAEAPNSGDSLWLLCGMVLTFGCFMPNMLAAANMDRVSSLFYFFCMCGMDQGLPHLQATCCRSCGSVPGTVLRSSRRWTRFSLLLWSAF